MTTFIFQKHILFLCQDPTQVAAQLSGKTLTLAQASPLRDDISTDEITPVAILSHYDDKLARYAHTGFKAGNELPIGVNAIHDSGINVIVGGNRYGKGSSREHSPAAEKHAGIQLVIAQSFERLYRQNADNIGLFTTTNFGLIERIAAGETITLAELVVDRDALAQAILKSGGLLRFGQAHLTSVDARHAPKVSHGQTYFEKIIARHALLTPWTSAQSTATPAGSAGSGTFVRADWRFIHEYYTGMAAHMLHSTFGKPLTLQAPESIIVFEDHTSYVGSSPAHLKGGLVSNVLAMCQAQRDFANDYGLRFHRTLTDEEAALDDGSNVAGISHAMMAEHYALPGQVVVGTDSHTPHSGALGCVAFGVGTTDMANAFVTGAVRMTVPKMLKIALNGPLAVWHHRQRYCAALASKKRYQIRSGRRQGV